MVTITKAAYGVVKDKTQMDGIIVTGKAIEGQKVSNALFGSDPKPGKKKVLYVEYIEDGEAKAQFFNENTTIYFGPAINHCPVCKGTGKQTIHMSTLGKPEEDHDCEIKCIHCDGKPMPEEYANKLAKELEREKKCGVNAVAKADHTTFQTQKE